MSTNTFDLEVSGLAGLAKRIEAERDKQAQVEALFPAGYGALRSTERLRAVSVAYQENPGLRREILEFIERDLRRSDTTRAVSPEEMQENLAESIRFSEQAFQRDIERRSRTYKQSEIRSAAQTRMRSAAQARLISTQDQESYNSSSNGLMGAISRATDYTDEGAWDISNNADNSAFMAGYGGATKIRDKGVYDAETGKFKAKAAPKPQVPMAPQAGRRKIRLDD